jgi:hypothetical protein
VVAKNKAKKYQLVRVPLPLYELVQRRAAQASQPVAGGRVSAYQLGNEALSEFLKGGISKQKMGRLAPYLISCPRSIKWGHAYFDPAILARLRQQLNNFKEGSPCFQVEGCRSINPSNVLWAVLLDKYKEEPVFPEILSLCLCQESRRLTG